jgi:hypothetical protein
MKNSIKILTVVFAIFLASTDGFSTDPSLAVRIKSLGSRNFAIYIDNFNDKRIKISLRDTAGHVLYNKNIKGESSYAKKYNVKNLPKGTYVLDFENEMSSRSYAIVLSESDLKVVDNYEPLVSSLEDTGVFKPFVRHRGDVVDLMVFSPELTKHEIRIYDHRNEIIFRDVQDKKMNIEKQYDLSLLRSGKYNFVVLSQGQRYNYRMDID